MGKRHGNQRKHRRHGSQDAAFYVCYADRLRRLLILRSR